MKGRTFITIILSIVSYGLMVSANLDRSQTILWSPERKLVWDDFQGVLDKKVLLANGLEAPKARRDSSKSYSYSEAAAYCSHAIMFNSTQTRDSIIFEVKNVFNKEKSWKSTTTDHILNHEQRHFDLGEVFARRFRKYIIDSLTVKNMSKVNTIFNRFMQADKDEQLRYDSITAHSENIIMQEVYNKRIDSMLSDLEMHAAVKFSKSLK